MQSFFASRALAAESGHAAGRALLAALYEAHVGGDLPEICLAPRGKPYFADSPWYFSITHTRRHAFCVLSDQPVGIDAEELDRPIRLDLAEKMLSAGELRQFQAAEDPHKALLSFWVLKEAQGKLTGKGIGFHPKDTDFILPDQRIQEIDGCLVATVW